MGEAFKSLTGRAGKVAGLWLGRKVRVGRPGSRHMLGPMFFWLPPPPPSPHPLPTARAGCLPHVGPTVTLTLFHTRFFFSQPGALPRGNPCLLLTIRS